MKKELACSCLILLISGCATAVKTGHLDDYSKLQAGKYLERAYVNPKFMLEKKYNRAVILVEAANIPDFSEFKAAEIKDYLKEDAIRKIKYSTVFKEVTDVMPGENSRSNTLICKFIIAEINPGNRMARWCFGEFGAGHSKVQIEGVFRDAETGEEMLLFADRRTGGAVLDITGGDAYNLITEDMRNIVKAVVLTLQDLKS